MTAHLGTYFQRHIISGSSEGRHGCRQSRGVRPISIVRHGSVGTPHLQNSLLLPDR